MKRKIKHIESEIGLSIEVYIKELAVSGKSLKQASELLGISESSFCLFCFDFDLIKYFKSEIEKQNSENKNETAKSKSLKGLEKAQKLNPNYKWVTINGIKDTIRGHCKRTGLSYSTAKKRIARGYSLKQAITGR